MREGGGERGTNNLEKQKHILNLGGFFKILRFLFEVLKIVQQNIFTSNEKKLEWPVEIRNKPAKNQKRSF